MSNKQYDILKFIALVLIPALSFFYSTLAGIWGLPRGQETAATFAAISTLLGVALKWASDRYDRDGDGEYDREYQGTFKIHTNEDGSAYKLELDQTPDELEKMKSFSLKVVHERD